MIIVGLFAKWQPTTLFSDMYRILFQWLLRFADYDPRLLGWWCTRHDNDDYYYYCGLVTKTFAQLLYTHSRHYLSDVIPGHISNHPLHLLCLHPFDQQAEQLTVLGINSQQQTWTESSSSSPPRRIVCHSFAHRQPIIIVSALISMAQQFLKRHSHRVYR